MSNLSIHDHSDRISDFLSALAARQPTPGGGSVAALAGALASAMGEMVVNYSLGRKNLAEHQQFLEASLTKLARARGVLLELMIEDQAAYEALSAARKLPADAPDRAGRFDAALLACIRVPQAIAATAAAVLGLCDQLVERSNRYLLSDLAVSAELAMATIRCATCNIRVNLADVPDPAERSQIERASEQLIASAVSIVQRTLPRIWGRIQQPR